MKQFCELKHHIFIKFKIYFKILYHENKIIIFAWFEIPRIMNLANLLSQSDWNNLTRNHPSYATDWHVTVTYRHTFTKLKIESLRVGTRSNVWTLVLVVGKFSTTRSPSFSLPNYVCQTKLIDRSALVLQIASLALPALPLFLSQSLSVCQTKLIDRSALVLLNSISSTLKKKKKKKKKGGGRKKERFNLYESLFPNLILRKWYTFTLFSFTSIYCENLWSKWPLSCSLIHCLCIPDTQSWHHSSWFGWPFGPISDISYSNSQRSWNGHISKSETSVSSGHKVKIFELIIYQL